ncbi:MAG: potassium transporter Kup [Gemmatimonadota bacterium]|nr:potassium transporter Kup [Gemmatimonadota bacterium]
MRERPTRSTGTAPGHKPVREEARGAYLAFMSLAALGVVYGDIGTSPIYALRESLHGAYGVNASPANVLGVLSLIFWSLILVISVKYLSFIMRADNRGEGGIIALTALIAPPGTVATGRRRLLVLAGLFGAALLYGDSMITPAISVLSAIEGLEVATPFFRPYVVPITVAILLGLFSLQRRGTASVGSLFGPVMLVWFTTLGVLGASHVIHNPSVFQALDPRHAATFFLHNGTKGFFVLGSVFLVVTGGEALYTDMGHFGKRPIRISWFGLVLPALLLNYFGQGALVIARPEAIEQPYYFMAPGWALYPLVGLTTIATVIASQAVISGAFSLTRQAVQLGYVPRLAIRHTSAREVGQIYVPAVNWALAAAAIGLVIGFGTSSQLAHAYGVAVTTNMTFATILFASLARTRLGWPRWAVFLLIGGFLIVDLAFWGANLPKIRTGGWFPLVIASLVFTGMITWRRGRILLGRRLRKQSFPLDLFVRQVERSPPVRVPGTAVYMHGGDATPPALLHNLEHNKVLHERVFLLKVENHEIPTVETGDRIGVEELGEGIYRITAHYGFAQDPHVPAALAQLPDRGIEFRPMDTTYFLGRENLLPVGEGEMARWRSRLFALLSRNALDATSFFHLPPNRVVELGSQVEI